jgi:hypothetical protein
MNIKIHQATTLIRISALGLLAGSACQKELLIEDPDGALGASKAPVKVELTLAKQQQVAAQEGRLGLFDPMTGNDNEHLIPVQLAGIREGGKHILIMMMPGGSPGLRKFKLVERSTPFGDTLKASMDNKSGQVVIYENSHKVLQYNYQTVYEKDVIRPLNEKLEEHTRSGRDTFITTSIYAVPRSDYIHPLYGLTGEMLTRDWPIGGHPHHRAIFWAWPEVEYGQERGDIYALQRIFARPTGNIELISGPVYAQILAENLWMWEDKEPIVREHALIRIYRASPADRVIDLVIRLDALKDSITIATRNTDSYGGLNLRMMTPELQEISYFTDGDDAEPQRAWSDFSGIFEGNASPSGLMVLQHRDNPEYPGAWVEYPNLAWVQPTFPAPGTRFPLEKKESLVLRYRLVVHEGGKPGKDISEKRWDAFHHPSAPEYTFMTQKK